MSRRQPPARVVAPPQVQSTSRVPVVVARSGRRTLVRLELRSVALVAFLVYLTILAAFLIAGIVLWQVAAAAGAITKLEDGLTSVGFGTVTLHGGVILAASAAVGVALVVVGTLVSVIGAVLYNAVAGLVGGLKAHVLEDEQTRRPVV